jgi:hypothetical protein
MFSLFFVGVSVVAKIGCFINARKGIPARPSGFPMIGPVLFILPAAVALAFLGKLDSPLVYIWGAVALVDFLLEPGAYLSSIRELYKSLLK